MVEEDLLTFKFWGLNGKASALEIRILLLFKINGRHFNWLLRELMSLNTFFVKWAEHHFFTLLKLKEHVFSVDMNYEKSWNFNFVLCQNFLD